VPRLSSIWSVFWITFAADRPSLALLAIIWADSNQEGKKQQKKAGSGYRLIATGGATTAKRFRSLK
jgi:hypothetical protein